MSAAPQRRKPPSSSGLVLKANVEPIRSAPAPVTEPDEAVAAEEPAVDTPNLQAVPSEPEPTAASAAKQAKPRRRAAQPVPDEGTTGSEDRMRPSNVHVPVELVDKLRDRSQKTGLTNGEIILVAIEETAAAGKLESLVHPGKTVGGSLFAPRPSNRASSLAAGHKAPVNYRLREGDYAVLDKLVTDYKAPSRNHLIVAALKGYLD